MKKKGTFTRGGFLPADHWLFGAGPIVAGRAISQPHRKMTAVARGNPKPPENN